MEQTQYQCDECPKIFTRKSSVNRHRMRSHSELNKRIKRYQCDECPKMYSRKFCLDRHRMQSHEQNAMFICYNAPHCKAFFTDEEHFNRHLKRCLELQCNLCKKVFLHNRSLKRHKSRHKPFVKLICENSPQCRATFSEENNLQRHLEKCQPKHKCDICLKNFCRNTTLKRHRREIHIQEDGGDNRSESPDALECRDSFSNTSAEASE